MKSSHFTTPRTLAECQFALNADPIERTGGAAQQRIADRVQYVRRELRDGGETHYVYTHGTQEGSMTSGAIRELIAGYKRFST